MAVRAVSFAVLATPLWGLRLTTDVAAPAEQMTQYNKKGGVAIDGPDGTTLHVYEA